MITVFDLITALYTYVLFFFFVFFFNITDKTFSNTLIRHVLKKKSAEDFMRGLF